MAWRPLYQPQLGHTTWGNFTTVQRGHTLRAEAVSFQLLARPIRVFDFDRFFLGTAMADQPSSGLFGAEVQRSERRPTGVCC